MVSSVVTVAGMETQGSHIPRHNFCMTELKWGNRRLLRCMKVEAAPEIAPPPSALLTQSVPPLLQVADQQQDQRVGNSESRKREGERERAVAIPSASAREEDLESSRPWNLRTRREACSAPRFSSLVLDNQLRIPRQRGGAAGVGFRGRKRFSVSLTREQIEEDFLALTKSKLPKRPKKKRPKFVQQQLDEVFPGLHLSEITADDYKVSGHHDS